MDIVKALKDGYPFYYLPDMDFGRKESIFVPFFGVQTATITGLARLASDSAWCSEAIAAAVDAARTKNDGSLPTPPPRLPNRLVR